MAIEFEISKTPAYRLAYVEWKGPWSDATIRKNFERVARWAKAKGHRTGVWVFREPDTRRWETGIVVPGRATASDGVKIKTLRAARVAHVVYDPEVVSPGIIYHGLTDWLRWRKKDGKIKRVVSYREVYSGNPWTDKRAYAHTDVQFVVAP